MATLKDRADLVLGIETRYWMNAKISKIASAAICSFTFLVLVVLLPQWRSFVVDGLVIVTASITLFYVIPMLHRIRELFLLLSVFFNEEAKKKGKRQCSTALD